MPYKCIVVVRSDEGTVQRSLALDVAPTTLDELCEHLKTLDLRLQALPFTVSTSDAARQGDLTEVSTDADVAQLWKPDGADVNLDVLIHGTADPHSIFSSTYFGSEVVSLTIYPPLQNGVNADADIIEKQLVIPLVGCLAALKRAIYCSLPTTAGLRAPDLTVFHVTTTSAARERVALDSDDAAEAILHKHARTGTSLAVTYALPEKALPPKSTKSPPTRAPVTSSTAAPASAPGPKPQTPQGPSPRRTSGTPLAANSQSPAPPSGHKSTSPVDKAAALPVPSRQPMTPTTPERKSPAAVPAPVRAVPTPAAKEEAAPTAVPVASPSTPKPPAPSVERDRCTKVRVVRQPTTALADAETVEFWYQKKEDGILDRLLRLCLHLPDEHVEKGAAPCPSSTSLCVLAGGQTTPLKADAELREWLVMTRESDTMLNVVVSAAAVPRASVDAAAKLPAAPATRPSVEASHAGDAPALTPTPPAPRPASGAASTAATSAPTAPPPPPRRLSSVDAGTPADLAIPAATASHRGSRASHSATESPSNSMGTGSSSLPSQHTDVPGPFKTSLSVDDTDSVPVFISAPPAAVDHTGLEALAQLFVRWGDAEAFVQCTLRPGLMLEDLKGAILDEFSVSLRTSTAMHLLVRDRWRTPDTSEPLDTEAKLRGLVESASAELIVIEVRAASRTNPALPPGAKDSAQVVKSLAHGLAQRLFYLLASDAEMSALQRLLQPCEARLEAVKSQALSFFTTIQALSPRLTLPRTASALTDFVTRLLDDMAVEDAITALQQCLTQCRCVCAAQPLSLLRDEYFTAASFTDWQPSHSAGGADRPASLRVAARVVKAFCRQDASGTQTSASDDNGLAGPGEADASADQRSLDSGFLTDLFAKDVECMNGLSKARAAGAMQLRSRLPNPPAEISSVVIEHLRSELKHSFDSCSAAKLEAFIQSSEVATNAAHAAVLSIAGGLLAPHPVANGTLWLQEHFKSKMTDVLYTKMRTFDRSDAVALPHLVKCCWTILDPALDPSQLLVTSLCASYISRWALLALQLECLHRGLLFPPPPPYNTVRRGPHPVSFSNLTFRAGSTISSSAPSTTLDAHRPRERGKNKKVQYRYKFNWNELGSPKAFDRSAAKKK